MDAQELLRKLKVVRERPSRIADVLREPRNIVIGGPVANRLGLQVVRTAADRALWHARASRVTPTVESAYATIERDGIVVLPNFLSDADFRTLEDELTQAQTAHAAKFKQIVFGENFGVRELLLTDWPDEFPSFMRIMRDNAFLLELAAAVSRRRSTYRPHCSLFEVHKPLPSGPHTDLDYNQYLHADKHFAFVKAFFYLNDVDDTNAPYSYARGSHVVNAARLKYEYEYSLAYTRIRGSGYRRTVEQLEMNRQLSDLAERYVESIGSHVEPIVGKANTLIVSNNIGFHKRGPMRSTRPRVTINIDYKYLESPAQWLYPVLKHLYR